MNRRVAHRYALALMGLAEERKVLDKIAEDLHEIQVTIHGSRELKVVLMNPVVSPDRKLAVLTELFGKRFDAVSMAFITLLVQKGRADFLLVTAEEFLEMIDAKNNIIRAQISSAVVMTDEEQNAMRLKLEALTGKQIRAEHHIDRSLKGGFVARIGDQLVDASLRHQLEMLREEFKRGGAAILN